MYNAGMVRDMMWERGIQKICEACRKLGTADLGYTVLRDDLTVKFTALEGTTISDSNIPKYQVDTLGGKILALLKRNPSIIQNEIAVYFDISVTSVKRTMKKLFEIYFAFIMNYMDIG